MSALAPYPAISARILAPRFLACSMSSRTNITEPSPMTNPSRSMSNGRQAFSGSSLRSLVALIWQNAPIVSGVIVASEPPASMATAAPRLMISAASPIPCEPDAQALTIA
jgi:hypothetical protein